MPRYGRRSYGKRKRYTRKSRPRRAGGLRLANLRRARYGGRLAHGTLARRVVQIAEQKTFDIDLTGVDFDSSNAIGTNVLSLFAGIVKGSGQNNRVGNRIFVTGVKYLGFIQSNNSAEFNICRTMVIRPKGAKAMSAGMLPLAQNMITDTASKDLKVYKDKQWVTRPYDLGGSHIDNVYHHKWWLPVNKMVNWDTSSTGVDPITNAYHVAFMSTNAVGTDPSHYYGRIRVYFRDL